MILQMGLGGRMSQITLTRLAVPIIAMLFFVSLVVWYFYKKLEEKIDSQKVNEKPKQFAIKLLGGTEKEVIRLLVSMDYVGLQSDISRKINKLKVHRAVKSLSQKGIVEVLPKGRTKLLKIKKEFRELLRADP
ncbi:MAG: hypothetical protein GOU98_03185 [Candidatus Altiarchaeota archaeon]|nr:hypothetical protein [Candidatus Altiarchaeota archaeon]